VKDSKGVVSMGKKLIGVGALASVLLAGGIWYVVRYVPLSEAKAAYEERASRRYSDAFHVERNLGEPTRGGHVAGGTSTTTGWRSSAWATNGR